MHLVVLHAQIGNAGARLFPRLNVEQKGVCVALDRAKLIEIGVKSARNHATIAQQGGGLRIECACQQSEAILGAQQMRRELLQIGLCRRNYGQQQFGLLQGLLQCN